MHEYGTVADESVYVDGEREDEQLARLSDCQRTKRVINAFSIYGVPKQHFSHHYGISLPMHKGTFGV